MSSRDFPAGPVAGTSPSNAEDSGSIPGQGAGIPYASWSTNQDIKIRSNISYSKRTINFTFSCHKPVHLLHNSLSMVFPGSSADKESTSKRPRFHSWVGKFPGEGIGYPVQYSWASLVAQMVKNLPANAGDLGLIPGLGRSPGEGHGNPLQYSCLENPHGQRGLVGHSLQSHKELYTTEELSTAQSVIADKVIQEYVNDTAAFINMFLAHSTINWPSKSYIGINV